MAPLPHEYQRFDHRIHEASAKERASVDTRRRSAHAPTATVMATPTTPSVDVESILREHHDIMHSVAEKARLRRLQEEKEWEESRNRAVQKAAQLAGVTEPPIRSPSSDITPATTTSMASSRGPSVATTSTQPVGPQKMTILKRNAVTNPPAVSDTAHTDKDRHGMEAVKTVTTADSSKPRPYGKPIADVTRGEDSDSDDESSLSVEDIPPYTIEELSAKIHQLSFEINTRLYPGEKRIALRRMVDKPSPSTPYEVVTDVASESITEDAVVGPPQSGVRQQKDLTFRLEQESRRNPKLVDDAAVAVSQQPLVAQEQRYRPPRTGSSGKGAPAGPIAHHLPSHSQSPGMNSTSSGISSTPAVSSVNPSSSRPLGSTSAPAVATTTITIPSGTAAATQRTHSKSTTPFSRNTPPPRTTSSSSKTYVAARTSSSRPSAAIATASEPPRKEPNNNNNNLTPRSVAGSRDGRRPSSGANDNRKPPLSARGPWRNKPTMVDGHDGH